MDSFYSGKRVLVTGGAGVIGRSLVRQLLKGGAEIWVGDLQPKPLDWPAEVQYRHGDLNQVTSQEVMAFNPQIVFHLAATFERSEEQFGFWQENYHHNVALSHHVLTQVSHAPALQTYVFASSYLIYDSAHYLFTTPQASPQLLSEAHAVSCRNLCGAAKYYHEREVSFYHELSPNPLQTINARIYRSYGLDSRDIVSRWVRALLRGEPLTIFGEDAWFDYVFAEDVAEGLLRLGMSDFNGVVNLGTGHAKRVQDVVEVLAQYFPQMVVQPAQSSILFEASQADMSLFQSITHWLPPHTLQSAIPKIIAYERQRLQAQVGK